MSQQQSTGYPASYYYATARGLRNFRALSGDEQADVCIVGGGYTGLSAALHLAEAGYDVVLLEAARVGWGASGRNGGQLGSGQRKDQAELEAKFGLDDARRLWGYAEDAKALVRGLIDKYRIDCDLKPGVLHAAHRRRYAGDYARDADQLRTVYGYDQIDYVPAAEIADMLGVNCYHGGALDRGAAHLHPLNLVLGMARACVDAGVRIYENSRVRGYDDGRMVTIHTDSGAVSARHMVLACNGYLGDLSPAMGGRIMPVNNFIIATEPLGEARARRINRDDVAVADSRFVINYFRMSGDHRLLFGGGENYSTRFPDDIAAFVRKYMLKIYPGLADVKIDYAWGGTLAITMSRYPHFGKIGDNIYFAQGYCGHGVGLATFAGKVIAEAVSGSAEKLDIFAKMPVARFPGGRFMRKPLMALGMFYYAMRDHF